MVNVLPRVMVLGRMTLDLLFPQRCIGCGREGVFLCSDCRLLLSPISPPLCPLCGRPQPGGVLCESCIVRRPEIDGIRAPYVYGGVIRRAVHELKYRNLRALARPLAGLLNDFLDDNHLPVGVLVPVPLHPKRLRERGYNQSRLLAQELGRISGRELVDDCLVRRHYTLSQARSAGVDERKHNVADAFTCRNGKLSGKSVLLIDDVMTSGATLDACARALKTAGVSSVRGIVLAMEL